MKTPRLIPLITGFWLFLSATSHAAESLEKIKVAHWGHEKILIYAPLYIAMDGRFFEKEGLDIELVYSGNDDQVFATVLSGAASFGIGDPAFTAISREKGGEGKVVAALVGRVANWAVARDPAIQPFTNPKKLDGLRVTSFPSPSTTFTILSGLKRDLNLSKMVIKQLAFGTEQAALERGEADLAIMLEPQASVAESQGFRVVWSLAEYYDNFALTGVTATDSLIKNEPDTVQRFVNGLQSALTFSAKSPKAAAVILEKSFPTLSATIVQSATKRMVEDKTIPQTAVIDKEAWLRTLNIRKTVGDLKSLDIADACLDSTFAENAKRRAAVQKRPTDGASSRPAAVQTRPADGTPSASDQSTAAVIRGWTLFGLGLIADFASIISLVLIFVAGFAILKHRRVWRRLRDIERKAGAAIATSFSNRHDVVNAGRLINKLQDECSLISPDARELLQRFTKLKIFDLYG